MYQGKTTNPITGKSDLVTTVKMDDGTAVEVRFGF
jgi:hypothetical protein